MPSTVRALKGDSQHSLCAEDTDGDSLASVCQEPGASFQDLIAGQEGTSPGISLGHLPSAPAPLCMPAPRSMWQAMLLLLSYDSTSRGTPSHPRDQRHLPDISASPDSQDGNHISPGPVRGGQGWSPGKERALPLPPEVEGDSFRRCVLAS